MVIKIKKSIIFFGFATALSLVGALTGSSTASAYKCVGVPTQFYAHGRESQTPSSRRDIESAIEKEYLAANPDAHFFYYDEKPQGECRVTLPDVHATPTNVFPGQGCPANTYQPSGQNRCYPLVSKSTPNHPVRNDGSPVQEGTDFICSTEGYGFDAGSFACKKSGYCRAIIDTCDYVMPQFTDDSTSRSDDPNDPSEDENEGPDSEPETPVDEIGGDIPPAPGKCGSKARTNLIICSDTTSGDDTINDVLRIFVIVLSFGVGVAAIGGLAFSAIQYAQASDNEGQVSAARERIRNIVIGLFLYGFLVAIVNLLVPGGIIGS